jgi:8-oxo-dGTP diphosphatase
MNDKTLCFLIQGNPPHKVLLGLKKTGFGAGKYAGFGGGVETGETIETATVRELEEETGIKVSINDLYPIGHLTFLFPFSIPRSLPSKFSSLLMHLLP